MTNGWGHLSTLYLQHFKQSFERILPVKAGIQKIPLLRFPFGQTSVVVILLRVFDDKRYHVMAEAFLQCNKSSHPAVTVLKRVDSFKLRMECDDILDRDTLFCIISVESKDYRKC